MAQLNPEELLHAVVADALAAGLVGVGWLLPARGGLAGGAGEGGEHGAARAKAK